MKITYPREKRRIRSKGYCNLYVVLMGFYKGKEWEFADFWDLPYTAKKYDEAKIMAIRIRKRAIQNGWRSKDIIIAKINL